MRLSTIPADPGYRNYELAITGGHIPVVRINGNVHELVQTADTDIGFALVFDLDEHGRRYCRPSGVLARSMLTGVEVTIDLVRENEAKP